MPTLKEISKEYLDGEMTSDDFLSLLIHHFEMVDLNDESINDIAWRLYADNTSMGEYVTFVARRKVP